MADSYSFAVDVVRCIGERLAARAAELELLVGTAAFEGWLVGEAFLASTGRQEGYPFCEVEAMPTYASEGVAGGGGKDRDAGDLRVGGPDGGANHCWLFAEFVVVGDESDSEWKPRAVATADRLKRLGWKKSAALLIAVAASRTVVLTEWGYYLSGCAVWNRPALTEPCVVPLPGGGSVVVKAFDIKQNPADTLCLSGH